MPRYPIRRKDPREIKGHLDAQDGLLRIDSMFSVVSNNVFEKTRDRIIRNNHMIRIANFPFRVKSMKDAYDNGAIIKIKAQYERQYRNKRDMIVKEIMEPGRIPLLIRYSATWNRPKTVNIDGCSHKMMIPSIDMATYEVRFVIDDTLFRKFFLA